jgi:hypothetical protein
MSNVLPFEVGAAKQEELLYKYVKEHYRDIVAQVQGMERREEEWVVDVRTDLPIPRRNIPYGAAMGFRPHVPDLLENDAHYLQRVFGQQFLLYQHQDQVAAHRAGLSVLFNVSKMPLRSDRDAILFQPRYTQREPLSTKVPVHIDATVLTYAGFERGTDLTPFVPVTPPRINFQFGPQEYLVAHVEPYQIPMRELRRA